MTIFSKNLGEGMAPLALPWLHLCCELACFHSNFTWSIS